jgi:acetyl-CoA synthetase (ADP-forming)
MMASMISRAADYGAGFSACVSVGNQADLEVCDFLEYFIADDDSRAICVYVEGLKDGARFIRLAERCRMAGKPLLALKAGHSDAGASIARSHTASLAGSFDVWRAVCRTHGVITVDDPESLIDCAHFLIRFGGARVPGLAALSPSGGTIAVTADRLAAAGLELATVSDATHQALADLVPPSRGAVLVVVATTPQLEDKVQRWGEAALRSGKPTAILLTPGSLVDGARARLRELGCPYTDRMDDALRVLRASVDYGCRQCTPAAGEIPADLASAVESQYALLPEGPLTELEAKSLLRAAGIGTTQPMLAESVESAVEAAQRVGFPVVLKGLCRKITHKSDAGLVQLDLKDDAAVHRAWRDIDAGLSQHSPGTRLEGCLVEPFIAGGVEMIVGARWDEQFGPVVVTGAGGVLVELLRDTALAPAPVAPAEVRALIETLRVHPLLAGARGREPCDVEALVEALVRIGWLAARLGSRLAELDINPLLVRPAGAGAIALDARATLRPARDERSG